MNIQEQIDVLIAFRNGKDIRARQIGGVGQGRSVMAAAVSGVIISYLVLPEKSA